MFFRCMVMIRKGGNGIVELIMFVIEDDNKGALRILQIRNACDHGELVSHAKMHVKKEAMPELLEIV